MTNTNLKTISIAKIKVKKIMQEKIMGFLN
jgi:hypothetical protein